MKENTRPLPQTAAITTGKVKIEVRGDKLYIWPAKKEGGPVVIDVARLDRWVARAYRDGVLV